MRFTMKLAPEKQKEMCVESSTFFSQIQRKTDDVNSTEGKKTICEDGKIISCIHILLKIMCSVYITAK